MPHDHPSVAVSAPDPSAAASPFAASAVLRLALAATVAAILWLTVGWALGWL